MCISKRSTSKIESEPCGAKSSSLPLSQGGSGNTFQIYGTFDTIRQFDIDIGLCHSGYDPIVDISDILRHVSTHIDIVDGTRDIFSISLFFGETFSPFFHLFIVSFLVELRHLRQVVLDHAMEEKIGISAYRRSEVRIV
jgi:hypothetical protein